jgi:hypothetical protein
MYLPRIEVMFGFKNELIEMKRVRSEKDIKIGNYIKSTHYNESTRKVQIDFLKVNCIEAGCFKVTNLDKNENSRIDKNDIICFPHSYILLSKEEVISELGLYPEIRTFSVQL